MNIKELKDKFFHSHSNTILCRNLELIVKVKDPVKWNKIVVEDDSSSLEVSAGDEFIFNKLKEYSKTNQLLKIKGYLEKTEFDTIGFEIEEIIN